MPTTLTPTRSAFSRATRTAQDGAKNPQAAARATEALREIASLWAVACLTPHLSDAKRHR
jgi:hypothetical protein